MDKTKLIHKGRLLEFSTRRTTLPNGCTVHLEVIKHPGAALIVPFLSRDRVIILRQLRPVIRRYLYELPAGTCDGNERPHSCARREIIEETGYRAGQLTRLGMIYPVPGYSTEKITFYKAEKLTAACGTPDHDEIIRTHIVTKSQVRNMVARGKIVDAKTLCAFALCGWL